MPEGNAWKHAPERQARLIQNMTDPEWARRREVYRKARGTEKKRQVANWNVAWNVAGRPSDFPDFPDWLKQQKSA
jgi:hypothetical protein